MTVEFCTFLYFTRGQFYCLKTTAYLRSCNDVTFITVYC